MIEQTTDSTVQTLPYKFTAKERDEETGLYYYGARYLDPRTSRWLSTDPALGDYIPQAPVNEEVRKANGNLPGLGGVYNTVNMHLYHYAGNNPVKYTDPDGKIVIPAIAAYLALGTGVTAVALTKSVREALTNSILGLGESVLNAGKAISDSIKNATAQTIPDEDKDAIADHSYSGGHGPEVNLDDPSVQGIRDKIDEILNNPDTKVGKRKDGSTGYLAPDGTLVIHNPSAADKGTAFYDPIGEVFGREFK